MKSLACILILITIIGLISIFLLVFLYVIITIKLIEKDGSYD